MIAATVKHMEIYNSTSDKTLLNWQWKEPSLRNITHLILKLASHSGGKALDVGCGTGRVSFALADHGYDVLGIDIEERVIRLARLIEESRKRRVRFEVSDYSRADLVQQNFYDIIVCSEVLEHVADYHRLVENMHAALKPRGRIIITVPLYPRRWSGIDKYGGHIRRFTVDQMEKELNKFCNVRTFITGFPFYRLIVLTHLAKLRLLRQKHSNEKIWEKTGTPLLAALLYPFVRLDNFFAFTRLGDMLIIWGDKC
jgi:2-polyprenyl-3-methyl-5-hydroxy-6-metoxy-1,4-benzoquinol methylase